MFILYLQQIHMFRFMLFFISPVSPWRFCLCAFHFFGSFFYYEVWYWFFCKWIPKGNVYFYSVSLFDDFTLWLYLMEHRLEFLYVYALFGSMTKREFGGKIKRFRSDSSVGYRSTLWFVLLLHLILIFQREKKIIIEFLFVVLLIFDNHLDLHLFSGTTLLFD